MDILRIVQPKVGEVDDPGVIMTLEDLRRKEMAESFKLSQFVDANECLKTEPFSEKMSILSSFSEPYFVTSVPDLNDTRKRLKIGELDKFLISGGGKGKTLAKISSLPVIDNFYKAPRYRKKAGIEQYHSFQGKKTVIPVTEWHLEDCLTEDKRRCLPSSGRKTPEKTYGTFLDAHNAYTNAMKYWELDELSPSPLFQETFELIGYDLWKLHCRALVEGILAGPQIRKFILKNTQMSDIGAGLLFQQLLKHPVEVFSVDDLSLSRHSMTAFELNKTPMLQELCITNCGLGDKCEVFHGEEESHECIAQPVFYAIESSPILRVLDLSDNIFSDFTWEWLCISLEEAQELKTLRLNQCNLRPSSVSFFVTALLKIPLLQDLSLRNQMVKDEDSMRRLLNGISEHTTLAHLDIGGNLVVPGNAMIELFLTTLCLLCVHFHLNMENEDSKVLAGHFGWGGESSTIDAYGPVVAWRSLHIEHMDAWKLASEKPEREDIFTEGCWICKRCMTHTITYICCVSGPGTPYISLLPSWTNWKPVKLPRKSVTKRTMTFAADFLVPPGKNHKYLFLGNMGYLIASDSPFIECGDQEREALLATRPSSSFGWPPPRYFNQIIPKPFHYPDCTLDGHEVVKGMGPIWFPKFRGSIYKNPRSVDWRFRLSKCWQEDMTTFTFTRLVGCTHARSVKEMENSVKMRIKSRYMVLYELFYMFQGRSMLKNKLLMARNEVLDFVEELKPCYQKAKAGLSCATYVDFESCVSLTLGNNEDFITRTTFWELILQISIYTRPDLFPDDALCYFMDYVACHLAVPPLAPFPQNFMWLTPVANLFFDWRITIRKAHSIHGHNVDGIVALAQNLRLYENSFTSKHCASVFALSKWVDPSKRDEKRPYRLTLGEFQELLGRLILVRMCKTDEKRKRRKLALGLGKDKKQAKVKSLRERPDGTLMKGAELFRAAVNKVIARGASQIMQNREKAFVLRMEQVLKMVYEKVKGKMEV